MRTSKKLIKISAASGTGLVRGKNGRISALINRSGIKLKKGQNIISSKVRTNEVTR